MYKLRSIPNELKGYPGSKGGNGVYQFILNRLHYSNDLFIGFLGSGQIARRSNLAKNIYGVDIDPKICGYWNHTSFDWIKVTNQTFYQWSDVPCTRFYDPPYMFETRKNGRKYYKHEFTKKDHIEFLDYVLELDEDPIEQFICITHPECELYNDALASFHSHPFSYMTRQGIFHDCLWTNYDTTDIPLFNYDFLGDDFMKRQAIKRKLTSMCNKINKLSVAERHRLMHMINDK